MFLITSVLSVWSIRYFISESDSEPEEYIPGQAPRKVSGKKARRERKAASAQDVASELDPLNISCKHRI